MIISCNGNSQEKEIKKEKSENIDHSIQKYINKNTYDTVKSISIGTVSNGTLKNGKLVPYKGLNYNYFDSISYINDRAFLNEKVLNTTLQTYDELYRLVPTEHFTIMECSNKNGGKIYPHKTHQNGLSIDFMTPLLKDGKAYYNLDSLGGQHYLLDFDNQGFYSKDKSIQINFDLIALHLITLHKNASKNNVKISKVILKIELKDELFNSKYGEELRSTGIYFAQSLSPLINQLHDDHYHVDFEIINY